MFKSSDSYYYLHQQGYNFACRPALNSSCIKRLGRLATHPSASEYHRASVGKSRAVELFRWSVVVTFVIIGKGNIYIEDTDKMKYFL